MANYKLYFSDMDNTLLPINTSILPDFTVRTIRKLNEKGLLFIPCTGRNIGTLPLNIGECNPRYAIVSCGAAIYDYQKQEYIYKSYLDKDTALKLIDYFSKHYGVIVCFDDDSIYIDIKQLETAKKEEGIRKILDFTKPVENLREMICDGTIRTPKIVFKTRYEDQPGIMEQAKKDFQKMHLTAFDKASIEITNADVSKGLALERLCEIIGVDKSQCIYSGDSDNDIDAMDKVGLSLAPANAEDSVKEIADVLCDDVRDEGVAKKLLEII